MVITTLILILLVLVAVGIVWVVVKNVISEKSENISLGIFTINVKIKNAVVKENELSVQIKRHPGEGNLSGIKFIFYEGDKSEVIEKDTEMKELEERKFVFLSEEFTELDISNINKVSIALIFKSSSGKKFMGDIIDSYEVGEGSGEGGGECVAETCESLEKECGSWANGTCSGTLDCGTCEIGSECVEGICESSGLILWNKLGSDAEVTNSEIGSNFAISGSPDYQAAKFGDGIRIDAASEIVTITNTPEQYDFAKGTVEMWVKLDTEVVNGASGGGVRHTVFTWYIGGSNDWMRLCFDAAGFYWGIKYSGIVINWNGAEAGIDISADTLTHLAFTWDNEGAGVRKVYINGVEVASKTQDWNDVYMTSATFNLGLYHSGFNPINGIIDNFKWYDYAKTDFED